MKNLPMVGSFSAAQVGNASVMADGCRVDIHNTDFANDIVVAIESLPAMCWARVETPEDHSRNNGNTPWYAASYMVGSFFYYQLADLIMHHPGNQKLLDEIYAGYGSDWIEGWDEWDD
jgi:hypothetical protein